MTNKASCDRNVALQLAFLIVLLQAEQNNVATPHKLNNFIYILISIISVTLLKMKFIKIIVCPLNTV